MPGISRPAHFQKITPLIAAAQDGQLEDLKLLLDAGAGDINQQTAVSKLLSQFCKALRPHRHHSLHLCRAAAQPCMQQCCWGTLAACAACWIMVQM